MSTGRPGSVTVAALAGRRVVGTNSAQVGVSGTVKLRMKLRRRDRVTVKAAFKPAAGGAVQRVTVRR